ncbi:MAG: TraR/DksA C4-type zinc finger protein [Opitutaceae bacterium]
MAKKQKPKSHAKKPVAKPAAKAAPKSKSKPKSAAKPVAKPAAKKPAPAPSRPAAAKPAPVAKPEKASPSMEKSSKKTALRDSILKRKAPAKPIAFSLDEVRAIAKTVTSKTNLPFTAKPSDKTAAKQAALASAVKVKPQHVKAASLADILGFNPKKGKPVDLASDKDVPEKFKRYYKLLHDLRAHLTEGIERHSEETLKRSAKDDAGDLSSYGQHMADAGTDTFDRDFALSMVASEQEALSEIDAALKRIHDGTYGVCEITQKPIAKERLLAVPFTRHSAEAQKDLERNRHRSRTQAGLFGEMGEDGAGKMMDDGGGDE